MLLRPQISILAAVSFAGAIAIALQWMRRLSMRAQLLVLVALGVSVGLLLMIVVQLPDFPRWLAAVMIAAVLIASPVATRIFLQSLKQDEEDEELRQNSH